MQKEIGPNIGNRDTKATTAVINAAAGTSANGQKWMNLVRAEHQAMTRLRGVLQYCEATTDVKHCGVSAGAVHREVVDAKEFFEYTRGVLRAYVKPARLGALIFNLQLVLEGGNGSASSGPNCSDNESPNNKVSVVEVQWFVQPE